MTPGMTSSKSPPAHMPRRLPPTSPAPCAKAPATGAYGMSMASNYNTRPRPAEVLVDGETIHLIRARETLASLYAGEAPLP